MAKKKKVKCRNQACLLNENLTCGSPCRCREDFVCMNEDVEKVPVKAWTNVSTTYLRKDYKGV